MQARHSHLQSVIQASTDLIEAGNFGAEKIQERIDEINQQWESLIDLATYRKRRLNEAVDFYQVCWMPGVVQRVGTFLFTVCAPRSPFRQALVQTLQSTSTCFSLSYTPCKRNIRRSTLTCTPM